MRRMTISRSSLTTLAAVLVLAAPAAAQRPPAIQRPIQQAQRAADQTSQTQNPTVAGDTVVPGRRVVLGGQEGQQPQGQAPASHIVQTGETLWGLAQQYLGDPFLWPEIYRLNTTVVEDPHWIYPGEELRLSALAPPPAAEDTTVVVQQDVAVNPSPDSVAPAPAGPPAAWTPTIFTNSAASRVRTGSVEAVNARAYRAVREGEYFSSGFLTEGQQLNTGRVMGTSAEQRGSSVRTRTTAQLYESINIIPPAGEGAQAGDLLLAFTRSDEEAGEFGQVIIPTGLVRSKGPAGTGNDLYVGEVIALFGSLQLDQELLKVQPFTNNSNRRAEPISGGIEGNVLRMRTNRNIAQMQDVIFIDKGANAGVRLGDIMQIYVVRTDPDNGGTVELDQGRAIVVNTRSRTATLVIVDLYRGDVGSQSQVRQIRRMPS